MIIVFVFTLRA